MNNFRGTLISTLQAHAISIPNNTFIYQVDTGYRLSYANAWDFSLKIFQLLKKYNVNKNDRVVFLAQNHWLIYPLLVACNMNCAAILPLNPSLHRDELSTIIIDMSPKLIIAVDASSVPKTPVNPPIIALSTFVKEIEQVGARENDQIADNKVVASSVTLLIYTSGTTGKSKTVMLTADNLFTNASALCQRYHINQYDRLFCMLPTSHMNALMITGMVPLVAGASIYLSDIFSFKNAKYFWQKLSEFDITICSLVPSIMALLLKLFPAGSQEKLEKLRFGFCGAAPLNADLWHRFEKVFSIPIYQGYGLTETTCWAVSVLPSKERNYQTVGIPLSCCELKVHTTDLDKSEMLIFENAISLNNREAYMGEIWIKGPIVTLGYFNNSKLTSEHMTEEGYYRTGDLGYLDSNGLLHVVGRTKDIIIKNGMNIFSQSIDKVMQQHIAVRESKTVGIADELVGERIYTVCVIDNEYPVSEEELRLWAHGHLSPHMWPDAIQLSSYLPKGTTGKVSMALLRKIINGSLADEIFSSLNSWKYKRSQPSNAEKILSNIQYSLKEGVPIHFLAYWGCGVRNNFSDVDKQTLDRLLEYICGARLISQAQPNLTLIFTDVHVQINQIPRDRMNQYFAGIREYAGHLGFECISLSDIWHKEGVSFDNIHAVIDNSAFEQQWQALPLKNMLIAQAKKHLEKSNAFELAAKSYYYACSTESKLIVKHFPQAIFTTFNSPDFDFLLPELPKVYLYSYKKGISVKPWFVDDEAIQNNIETKNVFNIPALNEV